MTRIRALIVDDEPPARRRISDLLGGDADVEVVAELDNGRDAVDALRRGRAELLFLDVQMPELDGFAVIESVGAALMPVTIFVTAFDRYALKAFEVHALDYLLKPYSDERFHAALARARQALSSDHPGGGVEQKLDALLRNVAARTPDYPERIAVKNVGRVCFVATRDIRWIEAAGVYVTLHTPEKAHLLRESLASLETKLDPKRFLRIHRSAIVSLDHVSEIRTGARGRHEVVLADGTSLRLSRAVRDDLERAMEHGR